MLAHRDPASHQDVGMPEMWALMSTSTPSRRYSEENKATARWPSIFDRDAMAGCHELMVVQLPLAYPVPSECGQSSEGDSEVTTSAAHVTWPDLRSKGQNIRVSGFLPPTGTLPARFWLAATSLGQSPR